jgi:hypothetical protein
VNALITDTPVSPSESSERAAGPSPAPDARPCRVCAAALEAGQDWCLECGAAAPGRLGPRPSRRPAVGVLALTLFLAGGAIAASYAAVSADSARQAASPAEQIAQQPSNPAQTSDQVLSTRPIAPAGGLPTRATAPLGGVHSKVTTAPKATAKPKVTAKPKAKPKRSHVAVAPTGPLRGVAPAGASTYNPYGRPASNFGSAAAAIDGSTATAWTAVVDPDHQSGLAVGVDIAISPRTGLRALDLRTTTPGMTIEVYGASGGEPVSIVDPAWTHLATVHAVAAGQQIGLGSGLQQIRHLLVWITNVPSGVDKVALSELRPLH